MKRNASNIGLIATLVLVFGLLFGLQISYYNKVISIRKEQTKQLTQETLRDVANQVELNELVRYLNNEVRYHRFKIKPDTTKFSIDSRFLSDDVSDHTVLLWRLNQMKKDGSRRSTDTNVQKVTLSDGTTIPSEDLLSAYAFYQEELDNIVLRYVYDNYDLDSIPQLVNPHFIRTTLRRLLDERGINEAFHMELFNADGQSLYSYTQPGMLRDEGDLETQATQLLFASSFKEGGRYPYMQVVLSPSSHEEEVVRFAISGFVISIIVFVLGLISITLLVRQLSFQRERATFINNMTHELKTPVSSITLATEMLRSAQMANSKRHQMLRLIEAEAMRLKHLIDKVLQFSIFDSKPGTITLDLVEINDIILPVAEIYAVHAEQKGGELELNLNADHTWIRGNQMHLTNVCFNLLDNAVKYSREDAPLYLRISTYNKDGFVCIEFEDNGIGIPKGDEKKIFKRFYRVPTGHRHDVKGFGLGLSYVESVIHKFGGKIAAENVPTGGLRIIITIPVQE